ncbi:hypothetical protein EHF33_07175 [Deinococcus psychrotolerans]|uniref:Uncharacterized protein n=1 Tax=Deinococcus psychrotolerans TaxID=2489213 RepID=A0A3G8YCA5_9DEIO|nr:hypothetical protein [Deinococcus psychrotolerans]AZI42553.1 hypothetical protein EHF33_07175 [Deinococcus psychrotolerans]
MSGSPLPIQSGQTTTRTLLLVILLTAAVPVAAKWVQGDFARWLSNALILVASGWLLLNVDKGSVLAWRVTISLSIGLGVLAMLVGLVAGQGAWGGWIVTLVGLIFMGCGLMLVGLPDVREYLNTRWATWRRRR